MKINFLTVSDFSKILLVGYPKGFLIVGAVLLNIFNSDASFFSGVLKIKLALKSPVLGTLE
jgi:hypothetical protein